MWMEEAKEIGKKKNQDKIRWRLIHKNNVER